MGANAHVKATDAKEVSLIETLTKEDGTTQFRIDKGEWRYIEDFALADGEKLIWYLDGKELRKERERLMNRWTVATNVAALKGPYATDAWIRCSSIADRIDMIDRMLANGGDRHL